MSDVRASEGHLFFFAYDVGFDISLTEASRLSEASESPGLAGLRPVPQHLRYQPKPALLPLDSAELRVGTGKVRREAAVKIFDIGVLSVALRLPVRNVPRDGYVAPRCSLPGMRTRMGLLSA